MVQTLFDVMLPRGKAEGGASMRLDQLLEKHGFDRMMHEQIRADLHDGRVGLAQNRLPASAVIEDVRAGDVTDFTSTGAPVAKFREAGLAALRRGEVAVVTLAAGAGSRWTQGAACASDGSCSPSANPSCVCSGGCAGICVCCQLGPIPLQLCIPF